MDRRCIPDESVVHRASGDRDVGEPGGEVRSVVFAEEA